MSDDKSRINLADVKLGLRSAWNYKRGEVLASGLLIVGLAAATAIGSGPALLGLVLIAAHVANLARVVIADVRQAREWRDFDGFLTGIIEEHYAGRYDVTELPDNVVEFPTQPQAVVPSVP